MSTFLEISRASMHDAAMVDVPAVELGPNQVRIAINRFGITANNITYGVFGVAMRYWDFFPASNAEHGRLPVWGFGTITESRHPDVAVGRRLYGSRPLGTDLVVTAGRSEERSFVDVSEHRHDLPSPYNRYIYTDHDPAYRANREDMQILLWPLFYTSFMVEDFLDDNANFGATTTVISSASSKTSIGAAYLVKRRGASRVVGLTSTSNVDFTKSLGCYDEVLSYEDIETLGKGLTAYVDVSGNRDVLQRIHHHFGDQLTYSMIVGDTHWDAEATLQLPAVGPKPEFLFAPVQIAKRTKDWGRDGLEQRITGSWHDFTDWCTTWLEAVESRGGDAITASYHEVLNGRVGPSVGVVCTF